MYLDNVMNDGDCARSWMMMTGAIVHTKRTIALRTQFLCMHPSLAKGAYIYADTEYDIANNNNYYCCYDEWTRTGPNVLIDQSDLSSCMQLGKSTFYFKTMDTSQKKTFILSIQNILWLMTSGHTIYVNLLSLHFSIEN